MSGDLRLVVWCILIEMFFIVFMCMMVMVCFYFGLCYWDFVFGILIGSVICFDVMIVLWCMFVIVFVVCYLIVVLGFWMGLVWGVVLWVVVVIGEVLVYMFWVYIYGLDDLLIVMDISVVCFYLVFWIGFFLECCGCYCVRIDLL